MKRLMLDYFRRWAWVLALVGIFEFGLGWFIANHPDVNFEFWGLMLALWTAQRTRRSWMSFARTTSR